MTPLVYRYGAGCRPSDAHFVASRGKLMRVFAPSARDALLLCAIVSSAMLNPSPARAQDAGVDDGCTLAASAVVAQLKPTLLKGMTLLETKTENRHVTQTVKLRDGSTASVGFGGCAHVGFEVSVKRADLGPDLRKGVAAITAALKALPLIPNAKDTAALLLKTLGAAQISKSAADLPCGDAICTFELVPGEARISYSFAL